MPKPKASESLLNLLDKAVARELQVSIQYMWQHILWSGIKGFSVKSELRSIAITEMKHAETIAERMAYLGGTPTTKPEPIVVGRNLKEMIGKDVKDEEGAIELYKQILAAAAKEGDETTHSLFKDILADEEGHHDTFTSLLEEL